jgi:hypothetical protein
MSLVPKPQSRDSSGTGENTMDFDTFNTQAWNDHATDPHAVAQRLGEAIALVADEPQFTRLANLAHHVYGAHLHDWRAGAAFIEGLAALPVCVPEGPSGAAARRYVASFALSEGAEASRAGLDALAPSDRIRVGALAASNLVDVDVARAGHLLQDAVDRAQRAGLPATDPMNRDLAVTGHNLACALEEKPARTGGERALMILAAQTSRHYWGVAGTWLETERAEYRLANTWRQAGDLARAREHAQACLEILAAHDGPALERLFGWEALGLVERAAGNAAGHAQALARARKAFAELADADKAWCAESIEKLAA